MRRMKVSQEIREMEGKICQGRFCSKIITAEDVEEIIDKQPFLPLRDYEWTPEDGAAPRCSDCYEEWFHEKEFEEDYNPMHPEETREEFEEHEDYEPKDFD